MHSGTWDSIPDTLNPEYFPQKCLDEFSHGDSCFDKQSFSQHINQMLSCLRHDAQSFVPCQSISDQVKLVLDNLVPEEVPAPMVHVEIEPEKLDAQVVAHAGELRGWSDFAADMTIAYFEVVGEVDIISKRANAEAEAAEAARLKAAEWAAAVLVVVVVAARLKEEEKAAEEAARLKAEKEEAQA